MPKKNTRDAQMTAKCVCLSAALRVIDTRVHCLECNRNFKDQRFFDNHKSKMIQDKTVCQTYYRCKRCNVFVNINMNGKRGEHDCTQRYCSICKEMGSIDHQCFIKPVENSDNDDSPPHANEGSADRSTDRDCRAGGNKKAKCKKEVAKYVFFDFECTQDDSVHEPNLCVACVVCEFCAERLENDPMYKSCQHCSHLREKIFRSDKCKEEFCDWLFSSKDTLNSIALAHNLKAYDGYFLLSYLYDNTILPEIIYTGYKIQAIMLPQFKRKVIDSMNFLPMALAELPQAFGQKELHKGFFPHFWNTKQNQDYAGPYPDAKYYDPEGMSSDKRQEFYSWYEKQKGKQFVLQDKLLKYCISDVDMLSRCCLQFRALFKRVTSTGEGVPVWIPSRVASPSLPPVI
ncbi:uncharacterized protein LOC110988819 [Acanthaster planci]|uniref:DNA-directed DNA polymerase n=1 Tax=Acanthaster planci TaxID=133434 RepID=A0A8B7ZSJ7_ACAPL|nr:uncharacterized protein LOC110988819 [Acanthaster planci]XP_022108385.1 uncharacterized protein LOC110988819 [Acanthaster planci]